MADAPAPSLEAVEREHIARLRRGGHQWCIPEDRAPDCPICALVAFVRAELAARDQKIAALTRVIETHECPMRPLSPDLVWCSKHEVYHTRQLDTALGAAVAVIVASDSIQER